MKSIDDIIFFEMDPTYLSPVQFIILIGGTIPENNMMQEFINDSATKSNQPDIDVMEWSGNNFKMNELYPNDINAQEFNANWMFATDMLT
jgi:hypothetical protein